MAFNRNLRNTSRSRRFAPISNIDIFEVFYGFVFFIVIAGFITIPITGYFRVVSLQRILTEECGQNYSVADVALNGDMLLQACKIKNQTITIK